MHAFELNQLLGNQRESGKLYSEFLRVPDLSCGVYQLPAGGMDLQSPHSEDEVYYVISGKATITVDDEDRLVQAGSIIYVEKGAIHRFHSIEATLTILVFFAPAEYSSRTGNR